ncbi:MAG TPA: DUF4397 domain-containing protein [Gemmatimonadaceae bacterium]|nr:DUF4397 domain-containing protein [Gemmatimonadaceae bacterium]
MPKAVKLAVAVSFALATGACGTTDAPGPVAPSGAVGRIRLVNLITDATRGRVNASLENLVFTVDLNYAVSAPANLPTPSTAPYASVLAGSRTFVLKRTADTSVTVATLAFTIADGQERTMYAVGGASGSAITGFVTTDTTTTTAGQTRIRIVQMSPTGNRLDIFITPPAADLATATPTAANLAYQGVSPYLTVPPGTYRLRAVPAGTAPASRAASVVIDLNPVAPATPITLAAGTVRTFVTADNTTGGAPLRAFVLNDR